MSKLRIVPSLADLSEDIAGEVPPDLIKNWLESDQTEATHKKMLEPFRAIGTIVSSDSSGLSKLSKMKPLVEVLRIVNQPKEIVAAHGLPIGGKPTGVWIADNTQMFYPELVQPKLILTQMVAAMHEINKGPLHIGIGMHFGEYYLIGGGVYGEDADFIEEVAENQTEGGEIILSNSVRDLLGDPALEKRCNHRILEGLEAFAHSFDYTDLVPEHAKRSENVEFPAPFSKAFLKALREAAQLSDLEKLEEQYRADKAVVLIKFFHEADPLLLNSLSYRVAANQLIHKLVPQSEVKLVKSNGDLGIFISDSNIEAIEFARHVAEHAKSEGLQLNIGVTRGDVLLFDLDNGHKDIAGSPVNIASKLAEDTPERGKVFVEDSALGDMNYPGSLPFLKTASGVEINGVVLS